MFGRTKASPGAAPGLLSADCPVSLCDDTRSLVNRSVDSELNFREVFMGVHFQTELIGNNICLLYCRSVVQHIQHHLQRMFTSLLLF